MVGWKPPVARTSTWTTCRRNCPTRVFSNLETKWRQCRRERKKPHHQAHAPCSRIDRERCEQECTCAKLNRNHAWLMMALTPKRLFLYLCISISLLRPYTLFSRSPLVNKTLFENACDLEWVVLYFKEHANARRPLLDAIFLDRAEPIGGAAPCTNDCDFRSFFPSKISAQIAVLEKLLLLLITFLANAPFVIPTVPRPNSLGRICLWESIIIMNNKPVRPLHWNNWIRGRGSVHCSIHSNVLQPPPPPKKHFW